VAYFEDDCCLRCGRRLDHSKSVWLELNSHTGLYCEAGTVAENESQGGFEFGADCAAAILANGGKLVEVGRAARLNR
jgi:hypothetical protein